MKNEYIIQGDTAVIFMNYKGSVIECAIDVEDLDRLMERNVTWYGCSPQGILYAQAGWRTEDGKRTSKYMHNFLMSPEKGMVTDHIDGNGLNNRKSNLNVVTQKENVHNKNRLLSTNTSGYTGVRWKKDHNKWEAQAWADGKTKHLGYFDDAEKAYEAVVAFKKVYMPYLKEIGKI